MPSVLLALSCDMTGISRLPAVLAMHGILVTVLTAPGHLLALTRRASARVACAPGADATAEALLRQLGDIIARIWRRFTALTSKRPHESR